LKAALVSCLRGFFMSDGWFVSRKVEAPSTLGA